jgi:DNA-binding transcriptional LysR family regulator
MSHICNLCWCLGEIDLQDLASIRAFKALCEHQSLTSAARALNQPKSTISRRISQLEDELAQSLTQRQGNRLLITKAGEVFYHYCRKILSLHDEGVSAMQHLNNEISGELTIVAHNNLLRGWLSSLIDQFLISHPKLTIRLISQYQAQGGEETPDIIFWIGELDDLAMKKEVLGNWHYKIYAAPDYLQQHRVITHPRELELHPWIHYNPLEESYVELIHATQGSYPLQHSFSRLKSDNISLQLDAIVNGRGIGLLPVGLYNKFSKAHPNQLVECLPEWCAKPLKVNCYTPYGQPPYRTQAFLQEIRQNRPAIWLTPQINRPG